MIVFTRHARHKAVERGIVESELLHTIEQGVLIEVRGGRQIRRLVFTSGYEWSGARYAHKEVTVVYVDEGDVTTVITAIARYGTWEKAR